MVEKTAAQFSIKWLKSLQWHKIFHMFYIEPLVFCLLFSLTLSGTILRNQVIYQTCTTIFHYNESDCKLLDSKNASAEVNAIETELQPYVANLFLTRTLLESIVPAFCGLFIGSWSDHYGRKPLLIVSMIGFALTFIATAAICELSSYYAINPWWYILAAVPHSVLGGNCVFSVAAFCFISDITDRKSRPYRMIFMESLFFIGLTSGSLLSSFVYQATNATTTFGISALIVTLATIFTIFCVPESLAYRIENERNEQKAEAEKNAAATDLPTTYELQAGGYTANIATIELQTAKAEEEKETKNKQNNLEKKMESDIQIAEKKAGLFSYVHIKEMIGTCSKKRDYNARAIIWLVTLAMFLSIFVFDGVMGVMYLFVREKFHWSIRDYTFYETVSHLVPMFGALIGFLILRRLFNLSVVTLALLAFFSEILNNLVKGFASQAWHMYLSIAVGAFRSISGPMCRTIVSNIVPPTDLGKIFSIKNVLQSFAPFVAAPLYTFIYKRSLTTYPGLFNFVSSFLYLLAFIFIIFVLRFKLKHKQHYATILK